MSNRRERYLRREAERKARNAEQPVTPPAQGQSDSMSLRTEDDETAAQDHIVGAHNMVPDAAKHDREYAAYLASLDEDAERAMYLDSLGEQAERQRPQKEKITWHPNHKQGDNWHDYLLCRCRECTGFRKVNGIERWEQSNPGEPDPWDTES